MKKLQSVLELRDQNCDKCAGYEKQLKSLIEECAENLKLYERVRSNLQATNDQLATMRAEHGGCQETIAQLTAEKAELLESELQGQLEVDHDSLRVDVKMWVQRVNFRKSYPP